MLTAIFSLVATATTAYMIVDNRYAHATDMQQLQQRVLSNEINQTYRDARAEYWFLKKQVAKYPNDVELKQKLKDAEDEVKRLKLQLTPKKKVVDDQTN